MGYNVIDMDDIVMMRKAVKESQKKCKEQQKEYNNKMYEKYLKEHPEVKDIRGTKKQKEVYDHPDSISRIAGIIIYIATMIGGSIFNDRVLVWIAATVIFIGWIIKKPKLPKD